MASEEKEIIENKDLNNLIQRLSKEPNIAKNSDTSNTNNPQQQKEDSQITLTEDIKNNNSEAITKEQISTNENNTSQSTKENQPTMPIDEKNSNILTETQNNSLIEKEQAQLTETEPAPLVETNSNSNPNPIVEKESEQPTNLIKKEPNQLTETKKGETSLNQQASTTSKPKKGIFRKALKICLNIIFIIIAIIVLAFTVFTLTHMNNSVISSGISILNIDVSGLDREAATDKISHYIQDSLENNDIILKHNDFETNIGPEQIETKVSITPIIDSAFEAGSGNNIFSNSFKKLSLMFNPVNITPSMTINLEQLETTLSDISTQLPDAVKQSDYYIDNKNLILTTGKSGVVIDAQKMKDIIVSKLNDLSFVNNPIELVTISRDPDKLNLDDIYKEVHKDPSDARFDAATHIVYPEENGLDFNMSLDEAKALLNEEKEEYTIPLKVLHPNVTTNMIGMEAFPDSLSSFSTRYPASNRDRTTNLRLAANKVNGTVLLPGETFSYNAVVGERTIAAGYKEAAIYQDGQVVNGLGGGICQISSTLYNAALYANLEIVERRNHQFVPSYVGAGRDATVVYGSQDFKFKNNRNYAIKITCSVEGGVASFEIHGISEPNDCEVVISSGITSRGSNSFTSATYKTLKKDGETISSETVSRDTYKVH